MSRDAWNLGQALGEMGAEIEAEKRTYTLAEARTELARRECALYGHDYREIERMGHDGPVSILCERCGRSWGISGETTCSTPAGPKSEGPRDSCGPEVWPDEDPEAVEQGMADPAHIDPDPGQESGRG